MEPGKSLRWAVAKLVRHQALDLAFEGSNPSRPANRIRLRKIRRLPDSGTRDAERRWRIKPKTHWKFSPALPTPRSLARSVNICRCVWARPKSDAFLMAR